MSGLSVHWCQILSEDMLLRSCHCRCQVLRKYCYHSNRFCQNTDVQFCHSLDVSYVGALLPRSVRNPVSGHRCQKSDVRLCHRLVLTLVVWEYYRQVLLQYRFWLYQSIAVRFYQKSDVRLCHSIDVNYVGVLSSGTVTGQIKVNKTAPVHYIIPINDMVRRPL